MPGPILRLLSACLFALATVHAGPPLGDFSPVRVGEGPLVYFIHPEDESGRSQGGGGPRTEVMYLCDPGTGAKAVPVWRGKVPNVVPLQRLTQNLVVIDRLFDCYLWDMAKGIATPLWPGAEQTKFLKAESGKVHFLRRPVPDPLGMKLGTGKNGKTVAMSWFRARDKLCTLTPGDKEGAVEWATPVLEYIVENGPDGIWAVTADEPRRLCLVPNDGKVTDIIPFNPHWVAIETHAVFSPARDYVALSILHDEQDVWNARELIVVDVKRRAIVHVSHDVPLDLYRSDPPPIQMNWVDGTHLLFGKWGNEQVLEALSGKLSEPTKAQLAAAVPFQPPARERKGLFDSEWGKLWFVGDKELAGSSLDDSGTMVTDMEISPDEKWAVFCDSKSKDVFLLDGAARQKHRLVSGWGYDIKWLPAWVRASP